jgi:predicted dehydrogenase
MRVGFLGAGLIATYHSKSLRRGGADIERAGVHDPDQERAAAFAAAAGHRVCASEAEVLDTCDAVYICTWTSEHRRLVEAACERGLALFVEKPLATTWDDARALAAAVARAGVTNQVGLVLRRSPAYCWARHLVTAPVAGRVMAVVLRDDQFIPVQGHYASTWRGDVSRAGAGTLLEHSIHDIDMLEYLVGPVAVVSGRSAEFHEIDGIEDCVTASLRFESGAIATLASIWHDNLSRPSLRRVEIFCERRLITIDGDDWFGPVTWTDHDGTTGHLEGDALAAAARPLIEGADNPDRAFIDAARAGAAAWPDVATALRAHAVVEAIYRSAAADGAGVAVP